jgi:hypothetical protein
MPYIPILGPVVALVAWSMLMFIWLYATRIPAMLRAKIDLKGMVGGRGTALDGVIEDRVQWKAHNYNHLMEQPTIFYAVCLSLALLGGGDVWINVWLAWAYVGLRVVHSLIQATVNIVRWRFLVFALASLCLLGLTVHAAAMVIHAGIW